MDKVVLAYSGGLDTSVLIPWLREKYDFDVVTFTANLGTEADLEAVRQKALRTGASKALVEDVRDIFIRVFARPPRPRERAVAVKFLEAQTDHKEAYGSLLWSLLATNEFLFNH